MTRPLTRCPPVESRSTTTNLPRSERSCACERETCGSSSTSWLSSRRPADKYRTEPRTGKTIVGGGSSPAAVHYDGFSSTSPSLRQAPATTTAHANAVIAQHQFGGVIDDIVQQPVEMLVIHLAASVTRRLLSLVIQVTCPTGVPAPSRCAPRAAPAANQVMPNDLLLAAAPGDSFTASPVMSPPAASC